MLRMLFCFVYILCLFSSFSFSGFLLHVDEWNIVGVTGGRKGGRKMTSSLGITTVAGWSTSFFDNQYGPCNWDEFTECPKPPVCGAVTPPTKQYSPIILPASNASNVLSAKSLCIKRVTPYIYQEVFNPEMDATAAATSPPSIVSTTDSSMILNLDGGGVLGARCVQGQTMFLEVDSCGSSGQSLFSKTTFELMAIKFFNGPLHGNSELANFYAFGEVYEIEFFLQEAETLTINGITVYKSTCTKYTAEHFSPDLIISIFGSPSSKQSSINNSILVDILSMVPKAMENLNSNSGYQLWFDSSSPFLPILTSAREVSPSQFFYYEGSLEEPPCTTGVPHVVLNDVLSFPSIFFSVIDSASTGSSVAMTLLRDVLDGTKIYRGRLYQLEDVKGSGTVVATNGTSTATKKERGESTSASKEVVALIVVNLLLLGAVLILALTHFEIMVGPPAGFGGLNSRVLWDQRSFVLRDRLKALEEEQKEIIRQKREVEGKDENEESGDHFDEEEEAGKIGGGSVGEGYNEEENDEMGEGGKRVSEGKNSGEKRRIGILDGSSSSEQPSKVSMTNHFGGAVLAKRKRNDTPSTAQGGYI